VMPCSVVVVWTSEMLVSFNNTTVLQPRRPWLEETTFILLLHLQMNYVINMNANPFITVLFIRQIDWTYSNRQNSMIIFLCDWLIILFENMGCTVNTLHCIKKTNADLSLMPASTVNRTKEKNKWIMLMYVTGK
jgi:hypothetical protein